MLPELNHLLNVSESSKLHTQFIGISDSNSDGTFLIHHFLSFFLKENRPVSFVAFSQSYNHYNTVAQKIGTSLNVAKERKLLTFVDGLTLVSEAQTGIDVAGGNNPLKHDCGLNIKSLYCCIDKVLQDIEEGSTDSPVLIIDNLSILLNVGLPVRDLIAFIHYLKCRLLSKGRSSSLVLAMNNDADVTDEEAVLLWNTIQHSCSLSLEVAGLGSGFCKDVHGEITVIWRVSDCNKKLFSRKKMQFKLTDKSASFFAPGMSSAVL